MVDSGDFNMCRAPCILAGSYPTVNQKTSDKTMTSRFPPIEEFDDGQTVQPGNINLGLELDDPAADFLSREKATLGADADLFTSHDDSLLGGGDPTPSHTSINTGFNETTFPNLDIINEVCSKPVSTSC
jgi:hypothetical protein